MVDEQVAAQIEQGRDGGGITRDLPGHRISKKKDSVMIVLGLVLLIVGYLLGIGVLTTIGLVLLVVGAVLAIAGSVGRPVAGRRHYY